MAVVTTTAPTFDEIVQGTGRAAEIGLGTKISPSVTLTPHARKNRLGRVLYQIGNIVSTAAFGLFLFLAVGPHLLPYQTMTMLTGSMVPTINPGDVAVVTQAPIHGLRPGDLITYHIPVEDHRVVTHRIVSVRTEADGSVTAQTKGDANASNDPWQANFAGGTVWRVKTVIPHIGEGIRFFRRPGVAQTALYAAPALVAVLALSVIWRSKPRPANGADPHDEQTRRSPYSAGESS